MGYTASKLVAIARAEIGYLEKASNANLDSKTDNAGSNNYTKFARDLFDAGYYNGNKNGYSWCECLNDWCHWIAAGKDAKLAQEITYQTGPYGASCSWSAKYYRNAGRFFPTPEVGDQAYFGKVGDEDHTGIVSKVTDTTVYVIEGNTSDISGVVANGGGVFEKPYPIDYEKFAGFGRPNYDAEEDAEKDEDYTLAQLIKAVQEACGEEALSVTISVNLNCSHTVVEAVQKLLGMK